MAKSFGSPWTGADAKDLSFNFEFADKKSARDRTSDLSSSASSAASSAASSFSWRPPAISAANFSFSSAMSGQLTEKMGHLAVAPKHSPGDSNKGKEDASATSDSSSSNDERTPEDGISSDSDDDDASLRHHLRLLESRPGVDELNELRTTPIFTEAVRKHAMSIAEGPKTPAAFTQYGLLAGVVPDAEGNKPADPRLFINVAAPSSVFICGSQGSGKSHTLSCLLENCLIPSAAGRLPRPLTGLVFHYDTFISDVGGSPCEVAYLSSCRNVQVRVLCAPTNVGTIKKMYSRFPKVRVEELRLNESDLNTKRMLDLMAVSSGSMPLYLHVVNRILRDLRIIQQRTGASFNYGEFKRLISAEPLTDAQAAPLKQRLDTLESFMVKAHTADAGRFRQASRAAPAPASRGNDWTPAPRTLTIVDLSCPCVTAEMACLLFNICLSLFLEQDSKVGRVVALDEAHKYMGASPESQTLTNSLLETIRLQRHLGARVFISTQEPTISPKLLDLCSVTIVHRFTSPDWLVSLKNHLAGVSSGSRLLKALDDDSGGPVGAAEGLNPIVLNVENPALALFSRIVGLRVGEALLFAPSAVIGVVAKSGQLAEARLTRLSHGVLKVRVRNRITQDGGRSILAA